MGPFGFLYATFCAVVGSHPAHIATDECPTTAKKEKKRRFVLCRSTNAIHSLDVCLARPSVLRWLNVFEIVRRHSLCLSSIDHKAACNRLLSKVSCVMPCVCVCVRRWCQGQDRRLHRPSRVAQARRGGCSCGLSLPAAVGDVAVWCDDADGSSQRRCSTTSVPQLKSVQLANRGDTAATSVNGPTEEP